MISQWVSSASGDGDSAGESVERSAEAVALGHGTFLVQGKPLGDVFRVAAVATTLAPREPRPKLTVAESGAGRIGADIKGGSAAGKCCPYVHLAQGASRQRFPAVGAAGDAGSTRRGRVEVFGGPTRAVSRRRRRTFRGDRGRRSHRLRTEVADQMNLLLDDVFALLEKISVNVKFGSLMP